MTPNDIIQMIKKGGNPQQIILNMLPNNNNNPIVQNLLDLARKNDTQGMESIMRNLFKEQGRDFDQEFNAFKQGFK